MPAAAATIEQDTTTDPPERPDEDVVGRIYGDVGTKTFRFAVQDPSLQRTAYVTVDHESVGPVLAQVVEVERESDLTFDDANGMDDGQEGEVRDRLTAHAKVIGYRDRRNLLQSPSTPVRAGAPVQRAPLEQIASVFGLPNPGSPKPRGAYMGHVKDYGIPVVLDLNELVQKHVSVLAKTGAGKSYCVGVLMEEMAKHGVPIVVIDPHGEHGSLAHPNRDDGDFPAMREFDVRPRHYADRLRQVTPDPMANPEGDPLALDGRDLTTRELTDLVGQKLTNTQSGILHEALKHLQETTRSYGLEDIIEEVKTHDSSARWNLLSALESLQDLGLFDGSGTPTADLVQRDQVTVVNLRGSAPHVAEIVVARLAKSLFEARKRGDVPPFMLVVEEAHNFCPERTYDSALCGDVLRTIASEGRKFGMGLTVISQRPAKVDKNVLSQCNTEILLKVTNPNDLKALVSSVEGLTRDMEDEIQRLPVGVAVVSHPTISEPVLVEVRPRETQHGGSSVDVLGDDEEEMAMPEAVPFPEDLEDEEDEESHAEELEPEVETAPEPADPPTQPPTAEGPEPAPEPEPQPLEVEPPVQDGAAPEPEEPADAPTDDLEEVQELEVPEVASDAALEEPVEAPTLEEPEPEPQPELDPDLTSAEPEPEPEPEDADADPISHPEPEPAPIPEAASPEPADEPRDASRVQLQRLPTEPKQSAKSREVLQCALQVQDAADLLEQRDPTKLPTERVERLVDEVESLLARLARLDSGAPEAVKAHNALATQLVRYRRRLADPGDDGAPKGLFGRLWG